MYFDDYWHEELEMYQKSSDMPLVHYTSYITTCQYSFYRASYASAVLAVIVCLSVCPSVCLSQVGVVQRWLNLGSH